MKDVKRKKVKADNILNAVRDYEDDRIVSIIAYDQGEKFRLSYVFDFHGKISIMDVELEKNVNELPSIINVFPGARIFEAEIHDLFGIEFFGNPDMEHNIFLADEDHSHPLRKGGEKDA
ncbi:MAG: NADH-quinone oxidoreductase subunit C [Candidatus Woesearchaeota archaeon]